MNKKERIKWEKIRSTGKRNFVIQYGVIRWGIPAAILWSFLMHFWRPEEPWYIRPLVALVIFPIGGIFWGILVWNINENKYKAQAD